MVKSLFHLKFLFPENLGIRFKCACLNVQKRKSDFPEGQTLQGTRKPARNPKCLCSTRYWNVSTNMNLRVIIFSGFLQEKVKDGVPGPFGVKVFVFVK